MSEQIMIIRKTEAKKEQFGKNGMVWDYPMPDEKIGIAVQELNGRVPDTGWSKNNACYEICYVVGGVAEVFIEDRRYKVTEGDVFIIKQGEKSYIAAQNLKILTVTSPNWYKEQCEISDN